MHVKEKSQVIPIKTDIMAAGNHTVFRLVRESAQKAHMPGGYEGIATGKPAPVIFKKPADKSKLHPVPPVNEDRPRLLISFPDLLRAEELRKEALAAAHAKQYRLAYQKVLLAAEKDPYSFGITVTRSTITARYRERLDSHIRWVLIPWLPFVVYARYTAMQQGLPEFSQSGIDVFFLVSLLFCMVTAGMAVWIHFRKEKIK